MSGLTGKILPGDPLSANPVNTNFVALEQMLKNVGDQQVIQGVVENRHIGGDWNYATSMETVVGVAYAPPLYTRILPAILTHFPCEIGQPVLITASANVIATGVDKSAAIQLDIDGVTVATSTRACGVNLIGDEAVINTVWMFVATAATHTIELMGSTVGSNLYDLNLEVLAVRR